MIDFSVVIPTLHSTFIDKTLDSLRKQQYDLSRVEVTVVGQDCHHLVREDALVRFDRSSVPLAPARARNRGMNQSSGEVIALIDADCVASPAWLATLAKRYENPEVYVVGGSVDFPPGNLWAISDNLSWFHEVLTGTPAGTRSLLPTLNLSLRREVLERVGGMDESFPRPAGEDTEWTTRMRMAGYKLYFEPEAVVHHHHSRHTLGEVLKHAYYYGHNSVKVDARYSAVVGFPSFIRHPITLRLLAPILAIGATGRVFLKYGVWGHYTRTLPMVFLTKISWCLGAAKRLSSK